MNYIYPKLSDKDFYIIRFGGAGLGNILFTYARAVVFAKTHNFKLIWPTWFSFKLGTVLRNELDKRFYNDLFDNNSCYIDGLKKILLLNTMKRVPEKEKENCNNFDNKIIEFTGFEGCFEEIVDDYKIVYDDIIKNLKPKNKLPLSFNFENSISFHIRLGDFTRTTESELQNGKHNVSLPMNWFVNILKQIRDIAGNNVKAYIFSDGTNEELKEILNIPNVERITFGSAIADIIALSRTKLFIASGSSFSMWARYLGQMSTICYKNQLKQKILRDQLNFEIETDGLIDEKYHNKIKELFRK